MVSHPDPDTLVINTVPIDGREAPPIGLGLASLAGDEFDGVAVEIRFTARAARRKCTSTLVLAGEVRSGTFVLKAVWRVGTFSSEDEAFRFAPWPHGAEFLAAFIEFRSTGAVAEKFAKKLFQPRGGDRIVALLRWLTSVPHGQPRLAALLSRAAIHAVLVARGALLYRAWVATTALSRRRRDLAVLPVLLALLFIRTEQVWSLDFRSLGRCSRFTRRAGS